MWRQRQEREEALALVDVDVGDGRAQRPHDVGVADHRPLRGAGRAARVHERGQLIRFDRAAPLVEQARFPDEPGRTDRAQLRESDDERVVEPVGVVEDDHPVELRQPVADLEDPSQQLVVLDEARPRLGVPEDVGHLLGCAGLVQRDGDAAVGQRRKVRDVPLEAVVRQDSDLLPGHDAELRQARGDLTDRSVVLAPRPGLPGRALVGGSAPDRRPVGIRRAFRRSVSTIVAPSIRNGDQRCRRGAHLVSIVHDVPPEWNGFVVPVLRPARGCDRVSVVAGASTGSGARSGAGGAIGSPCSADTPGRPRPARRRPITPSTSSPARAAPAPPAPTTSRSSSCGPGRSPGSRSRATTPASAGTRGSAPAAASAGRASPARRRAAFTDGIAEYLSSVGCRADAPLMSGRTATPSAVECTSTSAPVFGSMEILPSTTK